MKHSGKTSFPHTAHEHMHLMMKCYSTCASCAKMCIEENRPNTAILCMDCADICGLAIKLHSSDSEFSDKMMQFCAEVCMRCAEECGRSNAKHCQECSEICYECAEACRH